LIHAAVALLERTQPQRAIGARQPFAQTLGVATRGHRAPAHHVALEHVRGQRALTKLQRLREHASVADALGGGRKQRESADWLGASIPLCNERRGFF